MRKIPEAVRREHRRVYMRGYTPVWRAKNKEKVASYRQRRKESWQEWRRQWRKSNPEKNRAEYLINNAVRNGVIQREPGKVFHHPDYSRPYYGVWLTHADHMAVHWGYLECPEATDYSEQVSIHKKKGLRKGQEGCLAVVRERNLLSVGRPWDSPSNLRARQMREIVDFVASHGVVRTVDVSAHFPGVDASSHSYRIRRLLEFGYLVKASAKEGRTLGELG